MKLTSVRRAGAAASHRNEWTDADRAEHGKAVLAVVCVALVLVAGVLLIVAGLAW